MKISAKLIVFITLVIFSCAKEKITHRRLSGGSWNVAKKTTMYSNGISETKISEETNVGKIEFEKNGKCNWLGNPGHYTTLAPTTESKEGYLDVDLGTEMLHLKIVEYSRKKFKLEDRGIYVTTNFNGHYLVYELEKN